jgi:4-amino-4-deoxy-L-arabinose transferase-like glycosyltransferase
VSETVEIPRIRTGDAVKKPAEPTAEKPRGRTPWSHLPLAIILLTQAVLALRLSNTAFLDEATYLYAGHREIGLILHGQLTNDDYATYFSGAPFLYPVIGAVADALGGLAAARLVSLVLMLSATVCLYAATRHLFDRRSAEFAAALFALSGPALFMSHFATFDAPAVLLLSATFLAAVKSADRRALMLETAILAVAAVSFKYAAMVFIAPCIAVAAIAAVPRVGWRWALARGSVLAAITLTFAAAAALLAGSHVVTGVVTTTTARSADNVANSAILSRSALYVGAVLALAGLGALAYMISNGRTAPRRRSVRMALGVILACSALIAPLGDLRLHTLTSLEKHAGYGLLLAAPIAGLALSKLSGRSVWRTGIATLVAGAVACSGVYQARQFYAEWPDSSGLVAKINTLVTAPNQRILAEEDWVLKYYLQSKVTQYQWTDTYSMGYTTHDGKHLTGVDAYRAAIQDRYFDIIVFDYNVTSSLDAQLVPALAVSGYQQVAKIPTHTRFGPQSYLVWQLVKVIK